MPVTYNRKLKAYQAHTEAGRYIAELKSRDAAELALIEHYNLRIADRVRTVYERGGQKAGERALKAARLLMSGGVKRVKPEQHPAGWCCWSKSQQSWAYQTWYANGGWWCTCYQMSQRTMATTDPKGFCLHVWAAKLEDGERNV